METGGNLTYIGKTNYRNDSRSFGIKDKDRLQHIYCIGKSGVGKTTLLKKMALSDIERWNGAAIIDPHGDLATDLLDKLPESRKDDLIFFDASASNPIGFNPLKGVHPKYHHLVASGLVSTFKKIWHESWGPRMEYILRFCLLTLLELPDATLLDIQPLLTNDEFRDRALLYVSDKHVLSYWDNEFAKYTPAFRNEAISPILNKVGLFNSSMPLRKILGQKTAGFRMQKLLDDGKILICNFSKGQIGEEACSILGSIILTSIQLAALHRANQPEHTRRPFYVYVDECHSFLTLSFADVLAEARKYGLSLFLCHQFIDQLDPKLKTAIFGNVGTLISFRVGATDAEYLEKEFHPVFSQEDIMNLPRYGMYLRLLIDGVASRPFSAISLPV
jgi:hypothetical protein